MTWVEHGMVILFSLVKICLNCKKKQTFELYLVRRILVFICHEFISNYILSCVVMCRFID